MDKGVKFVLDNIEKTLNLIDNNPEYEQYKRKVQTEYKSIYIKKDLSEKINALAAKHNTSFNNIVVSIIEKFFNQNEER